MKKSIWFVLLSSALTFGVMNAHADNHGESEKHEMKADANNDGKVSFDEFKAAREQRMEEHFKRRDTNADGYIDETEKKAAREKRHEHRKECKRKKGKDKK